MAVYANTSRFIFAVDDIDFLVIAFTFEESTSALFNAKLELACQDEIEVDQVLGHNGLLTLYGQSDERYVHGTVSAFERTHNTGRFCCYTIELVPRLWYLTLRRDCRIFQHLNVPAIVRQVLQQHHITSIDFAFRLTGQYPEKKYCVQYRESDFDFISRLLEQEGIFYFFEHSADNHRLVFADSTTAYQPIAGEEQILFKPSSQMVPEEEAVYAFTIENKITTGSYTHTDYNFKKPALDLKNHQKSNTHPDLEIYHYPGQHDSPEQSRRLARIRLEQQTFDRQTIIAETTSARLIPGFTFTLAEHRQDALNRQYLTLRVTHHGHQPQVLSEHSATDSGFSYTNTITAIDAQITLRPALKTPKPVIHGIQSAVVTGPKGEEIYTDQHGRIKVQFHWDRLGKRDEHSSCWIRVSQQWAGPGYGTLFLPRIGHEVVVKYINGDPDRPIVVGSLYHGNHLPPYDLPEHKTKSVIKTDSSPDGNGCNEIRFEDQKGSEELFIQAQKDLNHHVKNDQKTIIGRDNHHTTGHDSLACIDRDQHILISQDLTHTIDGDLNIHIRGNQAQKIHQDQTVTINGNVSRIFGSSHSHETSGNHLLKAQDINLEGVSDLTLKVGGNFVRIDSAGVTINGSLVQLNEGGAATSASTVSSKTPQAVAEPIAVPPVKPAVRVKSPTVVQAPKQPPRPAPAVKLPQDKAWIEVRLVDAEGKPIPGRLFEVTTPDGKGISAVTGSDGIGRVDQIKSGTCKVFFSDFERGFWKPYEEA